MTSTDLGLKAKDTIYVDVDDEITAIIEKLRASNGKIVALVLPKRAAVMQSVVNMRLLKRTADTAKKNLVLVTKEASLLPLAGLVGLYVAATPTSKPAVPAAPRIPDDDEDDIIDEALDQDDAAAAAPLDGIDPAEAADQPVGELAAVAETDSLLQPDTTADDADAVAADDPAPKAVTTTTVASDAVAAKSIAASVPAAKKPHVPNFNKFRLRLILAVLAVVALTGGIIFANIVLPKASIRIQTNASEVTSTIDVTLSTETQAVNKDKQIIPALAQTSQKTVTQSTPATGQQNNGEKATGTITITNCTDNDVTLPAGTSFSTGGRTFISQEAAAVPASNFSSPFTGSKCKNDGKDTVKVAALKAGSDYNVAAGGATISGGANGLTASASAMTGGTDVIIKVATQSDIDAAKAKIAEKDNTPVKQDLTAVLKGKGYRAVESTFLSGEQQVTTNVNPGDKADTVTVTSTIPFTMLGIKDADLRQLVVASVNKQIDEDKQKILNDGVAKASFAQQNSGSATSAVVSVRTKSLAGPEINVDEIKKMAMGKKAAAIKSAIKATPGVTDVTVTYSPFWVSSAPKNATKITVNIDK